MASREQSVGVEVQAACQAVRAAAREGDVAALERLLGVDQRRTRSASSAETELESMRYRAMLVGVDEQGMSACIHAAQNGHVQVVRLLLDHPSADPAAMMMLCDGRWGSIALMFAAQEGHVNAMRLLLDHPSADAAAMMMLTNSKGDATGWTSLMFAAENGHLAAMRMLLDHPSANPVAMMMLSNNEGTLLGKDTWRPCACCSTTRLPTQQP
jgi:hypothetical protein